MPSPWRTVRVFISSTFRDMHAERDWLTTRVFSALRERLEKHRVHLVDIDLRWGVTKEQADNDQVLDLCLDEIDECRPFFVGMLGERYGWISRTIPERVTSRWAWIRHHTGKSITELEILHGVLNNPAMHRRAFFFFRDPAFITDVPPAKRADVEAESPEHGEKLEALKQAIRNSGLPIFEDYPCRNAGLKVDWRLARMDLTEADERALETVAADGIVDPAEYNGLDDHLRDVVNRYGTVYVAGLEEFGRAVHLQLWQAIQADLNLPDQPSPVTLGGTDALVEEGDYHERFVESRIRVYVGRETLDRELAQFADDDHAAPCLVTGPSGSGKSAALARFVSVYREQHPEALVIPHFIGAGPASTNLRLMLERLCHLLRDAFRFNDAVEQDTQKLTVQLREFLGRVPQNRRVVFVIDALDQLDDTECALPLSWLPWQWPTHVKLIASCITDRVSRVPGRGTGREALPPGDVFAAFRHRPHHHVPIPSLTDGERRQIIREMPAISAKTLDDEQVALLVSNPATGNPLFLLVALVELRGFGSFEQLGRRIESFPRDGDTLTAIFTQVIERLEAEFDADVVQAVLSLLASARRGLSQRELLDLVEGTRISIEASTSDLFPILRQLRPYLQPRGELIDFYHRHLFEAVRHRYLDLPRPRRAAHVRLADYFQGQGYALDPLEELPARATRRPRAARSVNVRKVDELPWQVLEAAQQSRVGDLHEELERDCGRIETLFQELPFLEAKNEAGLAFELVGDFGKAVEVLPEDRPRRRLLKLLEEALRRDIHFIHRHYQDYPQALFQCLWNTCWWYDSPEAAEHHDRLEGGPAPMAPPWERPGLKLYTLLETCRRLREESTPSSPWIRSLRPPAMPVGTALVAVLSGHTQPVTCVTYSAGGDRLATSSADGTVRLWDSRSGAELNSIRLAKGTTANCVAFSADGLLLAIGNGWGGVELWDLSTGHKVREIRAHRFDTTCLAFSPTGDGLLSGSRDGSARIWNVRTGEQRQALSNDNPGGWGVRSLGYSPDGERIVIAKGGSVIFMGELRVSGEIRMWDARTGHDLGVLGGQDECFTGVSFSPDGRRIAAASGVAMREHDHAGREAGSVRVWDADSCAELVCIRNHERPLTSVAFALDGRRLATGGYDRTVRIWDAASGRQEACFRHSEVVEAVAFAPDGRHVAGAGGVRPDRGHVLGVDSPSTVRIWAAMDSPSDDLSLRGHGARVTCLAFSGQGRSLVTGSWDGSVLQWAVPEGRLMGTLSRQKGGIHALACLPRSEFLIIGSSEQTIRVLDAHDGGELGNLQAQYLGPYDHPESLAVSPDGRLVAVGSDDAVQVLERATGRTVLFHRTDAGSGSPVSSVAFDGKAERVAIGHSDGSIRVWTIGDETKRASWPAHRHWVRCIAFSDDSRRIVSGSYDDTMRIWDAESGQRLGEVQGVGDPSAIAPSTRPLPFRALGLGLETRIEEQSTGEPVAFFPALPSSVLTHPGGRIWAAVDGSSVCLLALEGAG